jgi:hypothetical protein
VRKFLANVLYLFFGLPLALSALMLVSVRPWALDRETYKRFVLDDRLYAALKAPEIAREAPATIAIGGADFSGPALVAAAQKSLPVDAIKKTGELAIDSAMDAALGAPGAREVAIDLKPLKAALKAASPAAARDYAAALPAADRDPSPTDFTYRPSSVSVKTESAALAKALSSSIDAMPDAPAAELPSPKSLPRGGILSAGSEALSQALLNRWTALTAAFSAILLGGLGVLGGASAGARLSRAGKYVLIPSVLVLAIGAVIAVPGGLILQNLLPKDALDMLKGEAGVQLRDYLRSALGPIARSFFITGLVGASLGGLLVSTRRIAEPKEIE